MELSLQTYFDLGATFGLGDSTFERRDDATVLDILGIGISNPLGLGRTGRLSESTMALWRDAAVGRVGYLEAEHVLNAPPDEVDIVVRNHRVRTCEVTVYGVGVAFLYLVFESGVPLPLASDLLHCFEFAAYDEKISRSILSDARAFALKCLKKPRRHWWKPILVPDPLSGPSKRPEPREETDSKGIREVRLFTGLTHIAICLDKGDDVDKAKKYIMSKKPDSDEPDCSTFSFQYHGKIHYNWAECVIEPRSADDPNETAASQVRRMLLCIQIAHTFQGAIEAFRNLFLHEIFVDAEGFVKGVRGGLDHVEVNRLRALALAVISLTRFDSVTQSAEDRAYFQAYEADAQLDGLRNMILSYSEVLAIVQRGESELEQERRDDWLNTAVIFLTGFTMLTVLKDIFEFLKGEDKGFLENWIHDNIAIASILTLVIVLAILRRKIVHRRPGRR